MSDESLEELLKTLKIANGSGASLTLEDIAAFLPGLAKLMPEVGVRTWKLWYAGVAENWPLARFQWKEAKKLLVQCTVTRPKYEKAIDGYLEKDWQPIADAIEAGDRAAFERTFAAAIDEANRWHEVYGKGFLVWKVPSEPPPDLDFTPREKK